jgi:hypothetical protein
MDDIEAFFSKETALLPLSNLLSDDIISVYPDSEIIVQKTAISFRDPSPYCYVSLPLRHGIKGCPDTYFIVTFGLYSHVDHPRIAQAVEPYPNRWTHHVLISQPSDIDAQLLDWIRQAHAFKEITGKTKRKSHDNDM